MNKYKGLSLVELMISITLGLILMSGVVQVFLSSKNVFSTQQGMSRIQETGRLAMEFIGRDLRMASYYGCTNAINPTLVNTYNLTDTISSTLNGYHKDFTTGLRGYNTTSNNTKDQIPASLGSSALLTPRTNSDVLVIRGANERGMPLFKPNGDTKIYGYSPAALINNCIEGLCKNNSNIAVISNCERGRFFKISADPSLDAGTKMVTLTHGDDWALATNPTNSFLYGNIFPVHTIVYFVATSKTQTNAVPALWQKIDDGDAVELLQGVEDMYITYSDGNSAGNYVRAANVADWNKISSVRIELLVRGLESVGVEDAQPYLFGDATEPYQPNDNIIRQVFNSTFAVRARFN